MSLQETKHGLWGRLSLVGVQEWLVPVSVLALLGVGCAAVGSKSEPSDEYITVISAEPCRDAPRRICEGSGIRLAWQSRGQGVSSWDRVLTGQNGSSYLFVDGECRYWVFQNHPPGGAAAVAGAYPVRTGVLTEEQEEDLAEAVGYTDWERRVEVGEAIDAAIQYLWRPRCSMTLQGSPYSVTRPPLEDSLGSRIEAAQTWARELYELGEDADGPMRLWAIATGDYMALNSPLEGLPFDLGDYAISWDDADLLTENDPAPLVTDPEALEWLRAQWPITETGKYQGQVPDAALLPVRSEGLDYLLTYRDTIPLEDENGLIRQEE